LKRPVIKPSQKVDAFKTAFSNELSPLMVLFVNQVIKHGREAHLVHILEKYTDRYLVEKNTVRAYVTSASPLTDEQRATLLAKVKAGGTSEVVLIEKIQPELIGGVVVRVGDRQVDTTVARSLRGLKRQFENNLYIADL
jgi:F-type H+-transporting ATPase subunit delta